ATNWGNRLAPEPIGETADKHHIDLERLPENPPQLSSPLDLPRPDKQIRIALALHGAYDDLREFIAALPKIMPSRGLEEVELQRTPVKMPRGDTLWQSRIALAFNVLQS